MGSLIAVSKSISGGLEYRSKTAPQSRLVPNPVHEAVVGSVPWSFSEIPLFPIQTKLQIGSTDDPLEREADRMADRIMRRPDSGKCPACQKDEETEEQEKVAMRAMPGTSPRAGRPAPAVVRNVLQEPGHPLDTSARAFFEPRFQSDFSKVRVHTDVRAAESAGSIGALAFTAGQHIVFGRNQFAPGTS
jgi:hypothetical protein